MKTIVLMGSIFFVFNIGAMQKDTLQLSIEFNNLVEKRDKRSIFLQNIYSQIAKFEQSEEFCIYKLNLTLRDALEKDNYESNKKLISLMQQIPCIESSTKQQNVLQKKENVN